MKPYSSKRLSSKPKNELTSYRIDDFDVTKILLSLFSVVFVGLVVLYASVFGLDNKENTYIDLQFDLDIRKPEVAEGNSYFELVDSDVVEDGVGSFNVIINTDSNIHGVDAIISYDTDAIKIVDVVFEGVFGEYQSYDTGDALAISAWDSDILGTFAGNGRIATVFYRVLADVDVTFSLVCRDGDKTESNISYFGDDLIDCNRNVAFWDSDAAYDSNSLAVNQIYYQSVDDQVEYSISESTDEHSGYEWDYDEKEQSKGYDLVDTDDLSVDINSEENPDFERERDIVNDDPSDNVGMTVEERDDKSSAYGTASDSHPFWQWADVWLPWVGAILLLGLGVLILWLIRRRNLGTSVDSNPNEVVEKSQLSSGDPVINDDDFLEERVRNWDPHQKNEAKSLDSVRFPDGF